MCGAFLSRFCVPEGFGQIYTLRFDWPRRLTLSLGCLPVMMSSASCRIVSMASQKRSSSARPSDSVGSTSMAVVKGQEHVLRS